MKKKTQEELDLEEARAEVEDAWREYEEAEQNLKDARDAHWDATLRAIKAGVR